MREKDGCVHLAVPKRGRNRRSIRRRVISTEEAPSFETEIDNCVNVKASIKDEQLTWTITGNENTIDHLGSASWPSIEVKDGLLSAARPRY